jgi:hypothetical protein
MGSGLAHLADPSLSLQVGATPLPLQVCPLGHQMGQKWKLGLPWSGYHSSSYSDEIQSWCPGLDTAKKLGSPRPDQHATSHSSI